MKHAFPRKLASWLFAASGLYGIAVRSPLYWLEGEIAKTTNEAEYFYGFVGTALSAQIMFFIIAYDPIRFRPAIFFAILEKLAFAVPVFLLWASERLSGQVVVFGGIDFFWAITFAALWVLTRNVAREQRIK